MRLLDCLYTGYKKPKNISSQNFVEMKITIIILAEILSFTVILETECGSSEMRPDSKLVSSRMNFTVILETECCSSEMRPDSKLVSSRMDLQ